MLGIQVWAGSLLAQRRCAALPAERTAVPQWLGRAAGLLSVPTVTVSGMLCASDPDAAVTATV